MAALLIQSSTGPEADRALADELNVADELNSTALSAVGPDASEDSFGSWYDVAEASHRRRARARDLECRLCTPGDTAGQSLSGGVSEAGGRAITGRRGIEEWRQPAASRPQRRRDQEQLD